MTKVIRGDIIASVFRVKVTDDLMRDINVGQTRLDGVRALLEHIGLSIEDAVSVQVIPVVHDGTQVIELRG